MPDQVPLLCPSGALSAFCWGPMSDLEELSPLRIATRWAEIMRKAPALPPSSPTTPSPLPSLPQSIGDGFKGAE